MILTLAGPALLGTPAADAATAGDPVAAIQRQLAKGRGVQITDEEASGVVRVSNPHHTGGFMSHRDDGRLPSV